MRVREAMTPKVVTVQDSDTVLTGLKVLLREGVSGAPVLTRDSRLAGLVTEFDLLLAIDHVGKAVPISRIMTEEVDVVSPDASLDEARELLLGRNYRRVPVVDEGKVVGVLSRRDLLRVRFGMSLP